MANILSWISVCMLFGYVCNIHQIATQTCSKQDKVLIHGRTTYGARSAERLAYYTNVISSFHYTWDVATDIEWSNMTTSDFAQYRAIIFLDAMDNDFGSYFLGLAQSTNHIWSPAIDGNILIIGTDEAHHYAAGGESLIENGLSFVLDDTCDKTGLYMSLSYYYYPQFISGGGLPTNVAALSYFGTFTVDHHNTLNTECHDSSHIVAKHPSFDTTMTDGDLSGWECSVHEIFTQFPNDFIPLAIGESAEGYTTGYAATIRYLDGTSGVPYILVKGSGDGKLTGDPPLPSYCKTMENDECGSNPCACDELSNCQVCNAGSGCGQCPSDYFKLSLNHDCVNCQEYIEGCLFCQDYNGCAQCKPGWKILYDYNCGYYSCTPEVNPTSFPTHGNPTPAPTDKPSMAPSVAPTQGCGVGCDTARGCEKVYNIECDIWYCDCPCKEKISVTYLDIPSGNWNNYDMSQYLGDYYFVGYSSQFGSITEYPVYQHTDSDAYFSILTTHGWTYVQFNIVDIHWFFYGDGNDGWVDDDTFEIINIDSNPFDGVLHSSEWIVRGYSYPDMVAVLDDCSDEGFNFNFA